MRNPLQSAVVQRSSPRFGLRLQRAQRLFLAGGSAFVLLFLISIFFNSERRAPELLGNGGTQPQSLNRDPSKLHLEEFSRVQVKDGHQSSIVRGSDAKYFQKEDVTYIKSANVRVFRTNAEPVDITADSAKLYMDGEVLLRSDLEGKVMASSKKGSTLTTEFATYSAEEKLITAPGPVKVEGTGYVITAVGMDMILEADIVTFHDKVSSRFEQGGQVPTFVERR